MTIGDMVVIAVLILVVAWVIITMQQDKKKGKKGCSGCPNYGNCRAHIGCSNNPNNK